MKNNKIIVLDCDDVMLDYNTAWGKLYSSFFNKPLTRVNPTAYHAPDMWGVNWEGRDTDYNEFHEHFDRYGWNNMTPLDGAIEATHILNDYGYKSIVVSRMPALGEKARTENLHDLGFKFENVIGTGHPKTGNPKKPYIEKINPVYFVDDVIANFVGIKSDTKFVWLNVGREHEENNKLKDEHEIHHIHHNLLDFVNKIIKK